MNENDRPMDERIAAAVRALYHAPPATPAEEMWSAIEARLEAEEAGAGTGGPGVVPLRTPAPSSAGRPSSAATLASAAPRSAGRIAWWIGIAAALLIGLGIGRVSIRTGSPESRTAGEPLASETSVARAPGVDSASNSDALPGAEATEPVDARTAAPGPPGVPDRAAAGARRETARPAPARDGPRERVLPDGRQLQYLVATREHLSRSESFLAGVRVDLGRGRADPEFERWARSLLGRTRLLMASPAGRDPDTRRLLEDLELMLAQIVVTAATGDPGEARILGEGLDGGDLLYRLRSATESEIGSGGTGASRTSSL